MNIYCFYTAISSATKNVKFKRKKAKAMNILIEFPFQLGVYTDNRPRVDMSLHSVTSFWFLSKPFFAFCSLMLLPNSWEASNANFIVFGFIIYLTGAQAHDLPYLRQAH